MSIPGQNLDDFIATPILNGEESGISEESMTTRPSSRVALINSKNFSLSPTSSILVGMPSDQPHESYRLSEQNDVHEIHDYIVDNDLGARPEMIGKEASIWYPRHASPVDTTSDDSYCEIEDSHITTRSDGEVFTHERPPCIGKEATPLAAIASNGSKPLISYNIQESFNFPPSFPDDTEKVCKGSASTKQEDEILKCSKKATTEDDPLDDIQLVEYIGVDQYIQEKGDKKKTLLKRLKGFGKHFRVSARNKTSKGTNQWSQMTNKLSSEVDNGQ